jgi:hypothetical protein
LEASDHRAAEGGIRAWLVVAAVVIPDVAAWWFGTKWLAQLTAASVTVSGAFTDAL